MNQENITRTFSTGQSDITRHDAYTKAQGLNWANANTPKYVAADKFNGYEYVDLGLPSGTLWATMNVGATSETDYGLYFAWGEIKGYPDALTKNFEWSDYKWYDNHLNNFTKYNQIDKKKLETQDDAASMNMGGFWKMPSREQLEELISYTNHEWIINYQDSGINGTLFTSTINENTIFIPAAGFCFAGEV